VLLTAKGLTRWCAQVVSMEGGTGYLTHPTPGHSCTPSDLVLHKKYLRKQKRCCSPLRG
jgi:hypothetical protein